MDVGCCTQCLACGKPVINGFMVSPQGCCEIKFELCCDSPYILRGAVHKQRSWKEPSATSVLVGHFMQRSEMSNRVKEKLKPACPGCRTIHTHGALLMPVYGLPSPGQADGRQKPLLEKWAGSEHPATEATHQEKSQAVERTLQGQRGAQEGEEDIKKGWDLLESKLWRGQGRGVVSWGPAGLRHDQMPNWSWTVFTLGRPRTNRLEKWQQFPKIKMPVC